MLRSTSFPSEVVGDLVCPPQAATMVNTREIPPEAILLGVYLELQNGWFSTKHSVDAASLFHLDNYSHVWLSGALHHTLTTKTLFSIQVILYY